MAGPALIILTICYIHVPMLSSTRKVHNLKYNLRDNSFKINNCFSNIRIISTNKGIYLTFKNYQRIIARIMHIMIKFIVNVSISSTIRLSKKNLN